MTETAERIVLASRPVGEPTFDNFRLEELPVPQPGPGQMLLRTLWLPLDPYMRGRMSDAPSFAKPVGIGDVMEGGTVSEVVASNVPRFAKGDIVVGRTGWQTHALPTVQACKRLILREHQFRPHSAFSGCRV
jgi:NADPH-dependent curcumin reductase CurA